MAIMYVKQRQVTCNAMQCDIMRCDAIPCNVDGSEKKEEMEDES
jgi:hypothetical protein